MGIDPKDDHEPALSKTEKVGAHGGYDGYGGYSGYSGYGGSKWHLIKIGLWR